ncbi:uncharacterized protein [Haliotis cracherodii]|uniref:uncharacterized protein n=1 Tax=Haliotis cracherodii TaxID=6455 RepID=UPI0039EA4ECF
MSDSDSYLSYPSDEDMPCCPFELDPMSSESSDENPDNVDTMKTLIISDVKGRSAVCGAHFGNTDKSYLEKLQSRKEDECVFFPLKLKEYLSNNHACIIDGLKGLKYDQPFMYLGRSLVVSLNVDNDRIKIPKQLICDVIIFTHSKPVTVLSFVRMDDKPEKYVLYNSLLARHITTIMRKSLQDNISVINGVVEEHAELKTRIEEIAKRATSFCIAESKEMNRPRSRAAATSILQAVAECKAVSLLETESGKDVPAYTLSKLEFVEMIELIDDVAVPHQKSITVQNNRLALESACRLSRLSKIRILVPGLTEQQRTNLRKHYPKLDIGPTKDGYDTASEANPPLVFDRDSLSREVNLSVSGKESLHPSI